MPARVTCRLARDMMARGDDRATKRGRTYYVRRSAIDAHLRGQPRKREAPASAGGALLNELGVRR